MISKKEAARREYRWLRLVCLVGMFGCFYITAIDLNGSRFTDLHYQWAMAEVAVIEFYNVTGITLAMRSEISKARPGGEEFDGGLPDARSANFAELRLVEGGQFLHVTLFGPKGQGPEVNTKERWIFARGHAVDAKTTRQIASVYFRIGPVWQSRPSGHLEQLWTRWPQGSDLFWARWQEFMRLWRPDAKIPPANVLARRLQYRLTSPGRVFVWLIDLVIFGSTLGFWVYGHREIKEQRREFLEVEILPYLRALERRYHRKVSGAVPSLRTFIWSRDLNRLRNKCLARMKDQQKCFEAERVEQLASYRLEVLAGKRQSSEDAKRIKQVLRTGTLREKRRLAHDLEAKLSGAVLGPERFSRILFSGENGRSYHRGGGGRTKPRRGLLAGHSRSNGNGREARMTLRLLIHGKLGNFDDLLRGEPVDSEMAKAIVCVLVSLGSSGNNLVVHHRRKRTLPGSVRRHYELVLRKSFDEETYERALRWLLKNGILVVFDENVQDENYALNLRKTSPRSDSGQAVLNRVVRVPKLIRETSVRGL